MKMNWFTYFLIGSGFSEEMFPWGCIETLFSWLAGLSDATDVSAFESVILSSTFLLANIRLETLSSAATFSIEWLFMSWFSSTLLSESNPSNAVISSQFKSVSSFSGAASGDGCNNLLCRSPKRVLTSFETAWFKEITEWWWWRSLCKRRRMWTN